MEAFYTFNERFAKIRSKRIKKALKGMAQNKSKEFMDEPGQRSQKRKVNQGDDAIGYGSENVLEGPGFEDAENESNGSKRSIKKNSGKKRTQRESKHAIGSRKRSSIQEESPQIQNESLIHKGRGRGKVRTESMENRMKKSSLIYAESCSNNESNAYNGNDSQVKFEGQRQVRRVSFMLLSYNIISLSASLIAIFGRFEGETKRNESVGYETNEKKKRILF